MFSSEGEKVELSSAISTAAARGAVEKWLLQVQDVMVVSVKDVVEQAKEVRVHVYDTKLHVHAQLPSCRSSTLLPSYKSLQAVIIIIVTLDTKALHCCQAKSCILELYYTVAKLQELYTTRVVYCCQAT